MVFHLKINPLDSEQERENLEQDSQISEELICEESDNPERFNRKRKPSQRKYNNKKYSYKYSGPAPSQHGLNMNNMQDESNDGSSMYYQNMPKYI